MASKSTAFTATKPLPAGTAPLTGLVDEERIQDALNARAGTAFEAPPADRESRLVRIDALDSVAMVALEAGRRAALRTTEEEYTALVNRHRDLARKQVKGEIAHSEMLDLELIRWELDRIEDARRAPDRDLLKAALRPRIELAGEISRLVQELKTAGVIGERGRGGRR